MFSPGAFGSDGLRVRLMRVHTADRDQLSVRQRIESQLFGIDASSLGLASLALLFVRRIALRMQTRYPPGGHVASRALRDELMCSASRARRPWVDGDALSADAVLFEDEAELVACLIRDWLRGLVAERWWWQTVLAHTGVEAWLRQHVLPRGDVLAPALSLLAPRTEVVPWIARLPEGDARIAVDAVVRAFALAFTAVPSLVEPAVMPAHEDAAAKSPGDGAVASHHAAEALARLVATVPELQTVTLAPEQRRLLVLACVATRAPSWARTAHFTTAMAALDRIQTKPHTSVNSERTVMPTHLPRAHAADEGALETASSESSDANPTLQVATPGPTRAVPSRSSETEPTDSAMPPRQVVSLDRISASPQPERRRASALRDSVDLARTPWHDDKNIRSSALSPGELPEEMRESPAPTVERNADPSTIAPAARIETQFGGIFYLLNAWLAIGLYGDFTAPRGSHFVLSPWDLLALVGRAWFGDTFVVDSVWKALADLAVRDPEVDPDRDHALPEKWLDDHLHRLTARLQAALGADLRSDIPAIVCCHRALIDVTAAAVHVHLWLSELPLDIRVAGLDRDPGWIPAAGRSVYFHFA